MAEENWSQKQRKQIYLNYAADSMKENVYKYTQKWICVKSALRDDEDIPETKGNCSHWLWVSTEIQVPAAPAPAGDFHAHPSSLELSSLAWKLWNLFCKDRGGSGAPSAQSSALAPGNVSQIVLGHLARTRVHPGAKEASPFLCLHPASILPPSCPPLLLLWLFSGSRWHMNLLQSWPISLCAVSVFLLSILSPFLSGCSHMEFFSHKYSLSALDTSFCHQSHTFCPFSQQSHDLQVISSTKIGEVLSFLSQHPVSSPANVVCPGPSEDEFHRKDIPFSLVI